MPTANKKIGIHGTDEETGRGKTAGGKKTECLITKEEFMEHAKPIAIQFEGQTLHLMPREFSTGSLGYRNNDKVTVVINGKPVKLQIGLNMMVIGSKNLES